MASRRRIHQSLLTPPLFLGLPLEAFFLEIAFGLLSFALFGLSRVVLVYALLTLAIVHPALAAVTRREPLALRLLAGSLAIRRFYPARGTLVPLRRVAPKSCLPRI